MGELIKVNNRVKWTFTATTYADVNQVSKSFEFQNRKCTFCFNSGYNTSNSSYKPMTLSINFEEKGKFNPAVDVTVLVSASSNISPPQEITVTGESKQVIWSTSDYTLRGQLLVFDMVVSDSSFKNDKSMQTPPYFDTHFSLESSSKDFAKLLDEGPSHDVEFTFGDQTIKAHKSILCCRSDIFTTMLKTKMVEGETGQIKIQDMDASVFQQFLRCLYTGKLPELTVDIAMQLYAASDKYSIDTLKLQFAHFLIDNLSLENACEILTLADQHNDPEFKRSVMEYIFKEKVPVGEKWPDFCKENHQLAMEVLNSFCRYLCEKQNL